MTPENQTMNARELNQILSDAYSEALIQLSRISACHAEIKRKRNTELSKAWVGKLALDLREFEIRNQDNVAKSKIEAFFLSDNPEQKKLGLSEFLHDICIARTHTVCAPKHKKDLRIVTKVLWQVESEFSSNSREAVKDFNKLIAGSAENKLFVGPYKGRSSQANQAAEAHRETLAKILRIAGLPKGDRWLLGQIPHPDIWEPTEDHPITCWEFCPTERTWAK